MDAGSGTLRGKPRGGPPHVGVPRHGRMSGGREAFGQLVALGFDVAVFTPAPYPRHRL